MGKKHTVDSCERDGNTVTVQCQRKLDTTLYTEWRIDETKAGRSDKVLRLFNFDQSSSKPLPEHEQEIGAYIDELVRRQSSAKQGEEWTWGEGVKLAMLAQLNPRPGVSIHWLPVSNLSMIKAVGSASDEAFKATEPGYENPGEDGEGDDNEKLARRRAARAASTLKGIYMSKHSHLEIY